MSSRRWELREADDEKVRNLVLKCALPPAIARVLASRGFDDSNAIDRFLEPRLSDLCDPFDLPEMEEAVHRIWQAIDEHERIVIFGDYDVDGVTSTALTTRVLGTLGADVVPFIPDRLDEGYGLSMDAIERCLEDHAPALIVSVDCGSNSVESVAYAKSMGVDVIVTDHHEPDMEMAVALALVNPKLGANRSLDILSGVGVAFKLAHALVKKGRDASKPEAHGIDLRDYLDIVALGTVADIVPLSTENRILVRHGLERMADPKWVGLEALKKVAGVRGEPETYHLGFQLGPRINAAGRIAQPMQALQLLVTDDPGEAGRIARLLDETNSERRRIEKEMTDAALAEIDAFFDPEKNFGLVVAQDGWHPGVVGIVASRISRRYNRPAIVLGIEEDGSARGSCRSIEEYNMLDGLDACSKYLSSFGGHKMAAGVVVQSGKLEHFQKAFNAVAALSLESIDLEPVQHIDAEVEAHEIDWNFMEQLRRLRPFGQGNPEPVWMMRNMRASGSPRVLGGQHLKLSLAAGGIAFEAIAFGYPLDKLPAGSVDVAFTLKVNHWNGTSSLQLQIKDIRPAANSRR